MWLFFFFYFHARENGELLDNVLFMQSNHCKELLTKPDGSDVSPSHVIRPLNKKICKNNHEYKGRCQRV